MRYIQLLSHDISKYEKQKKIGQQFDCNKLLLSLGPVSSMDTKNDTYPEKGPQFPMNNNQRPRNVWWKYVETRIQSMEVIKS